MHAGDAGAVMLVKVTISFDNTKMRCCEVNTLTTMVASRAFHSKRFQEMFAYRRDGIDAIFGVK